jgi:biotin carboxyl carrier protein
MEYRLKIADEIKTVTMDGSTDDPVTVNIDGNARTVVFQRIDDHQLHLRVDGRTVNAFVRSDGDGKQVMIGGQSYHIEDADTLAQKPSRRGGAGNLPVDITPVTPSVVVAVLVAVGQSVEPGQGVIVLSAMKMETTLNAPFAGTVTAIYAAEGDKVAPGKILVEIEKTD